MPPLSSFSPLLSHNERNEQKRQALAPAISGLDASDVAMRLQSIYGSRKASLVLDIIVVGCGIGGLSVAFCLTQAGHRVTILESSPVLGEIGAGIQISPNSSRLLRRWGLGKHLDEVALRPQGTSFRRYNTGELIGAVEWGDTLEGEYGAPTYYMHRADLHKLLYDLVSPHATIRLDSTVVGCDPDPVSPSVTIESGEEIRADLVIGADGVGSYIRRVVTGKPSSAKLTGDAVYRAIVPTSLMVQDPELREVLERPQMTGWTGPGKFLLGYPIRKETYYFVLLDSADGSAKPLTAEGNADRMRRDVVDFEPRVHKMFGSIESALRWRLMDGKGPDKWVHESGRVVLLGDACHPILPFRAQGASMAIEDSAVLANLLSRISHHSQLKPLLEAYQHLRLHRTTVAQEASRLNQPTLTLPDGPEQRARDEGWRKGMAPARPADPRASESDRFQQEKKERKALFGYDADAEVDKWWAAHGRELELQRVRQRL